jgi:hypothetical protein
MAPTERLKKIEPRPEAAPAAPASAKPADPRKGASGRVVHDERGNAVWDWVKQTSRAAIDSTSVLLKKLELPGLKLEDTNDWHGTPPPKHFAGGGYDPYGSPGKKPPPKVTKK